MRFVLTFPDVRGRLPLQRLRSAGKQKNVKTINNVQLLFSSEAASMKCCRIILYSVFASPTRWASGGVKRDTDVRSNLCLFSGL